MSVRSSPAAPADARPVDSNSSTSASPGATSGLPKHWSSEVLLASKKSLLKRLSDLAASGGLHIAASLDPQTSTAIARARIPATVHDPLQGPSAGQDAGLVPADYPAVISHWRSWCQQQGLAPLPIMGAVVCIFLVTEVPEGERRRTVFVLELVRRATTSCFLGVDHAAMALTWKEADRMMFNVVLEQAQWALLEWKAIVEVAFTSGRSSPKHGEAALPTPPLSSRQHPPSTNFQSRAPKSAPISRPAPSTAAAPPPSFSRPPIQQPHPDAHHIADDQRPEHAQGRSPRPPAYTQSQHSRQNHVSAQISAKTVAPTPTGAPRTSQTVQGKRLATGAAPAEAAFPVQHKKRRRRTKAEMEADDEEARAPAEERAFYLSASKVATAIKMLAILQDPTYRPHTELQAVVSQQPLPPVRDARSVARPKSRLGIVLTAEQQSHPSGNAPIIVAAPPPSTPSPLPPTLGTSLVRPFSDYTPTLASPAWMGTRTASAPINGPLSTIPLSTLPRPVITSLPVPRPPPAATFALSPRQLLPWPDAVQALTQQAVDKTWSCIGTTMGRVNAGRAGEVTSSLQEVVHRAIRLVDPWCPKAKSPAEQVEAAKAREAAGGKLPSRTSTGAKPSPRIPVLPLHKGSPRLGKSQLEGETGTKSPALGQSSPRLGGAPSSASSRESTPMSARPSMSRSSTGLGPVHPLAQVWAKGTVGQRQVAMDRLLGAKGRSSPRSENSLLASPRSPDTSSLAPTPPPGASAALPSTSSAPAAAQSTSGSRIQSNATAAVAPAAQSSNAAPPLVPLPFNSSDTPPSSTSALPLPTVALSAAEHQHAVTTSALGIGLAPPPGRAGVSKMSTFVVARSTSPQLDRENSLLLEDAGPATASASTSVDIPQVNGREKREREQRRQGKQKEVEVQLREALSAAKRRPRGGIPLRFQLSNTPVRPFG